MNGKDRTYAPYIDLTVSDTLPKLPEEFTMKELSEKICKNYSIEFSASEKDAFHQRLRNSVDRLQKSGKITLGKFLVENISTIKITKNKKE